MSDQKAQIGVVGLAVMGKKVAVLLLVFITVTVTELMK